MTLDYTFHYYSMYCNVHNVFTELLWKMLFSSGRIFTVMDLLGIFVLFSNKTQR